MKIFNQVSKELKIASRGFYFYVEIFITLTVLFILLFMVPEETVSSTEEYLFYNMKPEVSQMIFDKLTEAGTMEKIDDKTFELEPDIIKIYPDRDTVPNKYDGIVYPLNEEQIEDEYTMEKDGSYKFIFDDTKEVTGKGYAIYDKKGGKLDKKVYLFDSFEDVLRLSKSKRNAAGVIYYDADGRENYELLFPGIVTEKYKNTAYALHNDNIYDIIEESKGKKVTYLGKIDKLNNRQSFVPLIIIYLNALMGIFIVSAYIFNDKVEGSIKAIRVSPLSITEFLLSKLISTLPISLITSLIIAIPIMKMQANYLLLSVLVICISFFGGSIGLLIASIFDDIRSSFMWIMILLIVMMLPIISYYLPTFSPKWIQYIPTHHMLIALKNTISLTSEWAYTIYTSIGLLILSIPFIGLSVYRFKGGSQ